MINIKVSTALSLSLQRISGDDDDVEMTETSIRTEAQPFLRGSDLDGWFVDLVSLIQIKYEELAERNSGWTLAGVNDFELHISR